MKFASLVMCALVLAACGGTHSTGQNTDSTIDALRKAVPGREMVALDVPAGSGQALQSTGQQQQAVRGERSEFYVLTRAITATVNAATGLVLDLIKAIVREPPTTFDGRVAVWGPYTEPLSPNTWRFTVTDDGHNHYSYVLQAKPKTEPDSAYVAVLSGSSSPALDPNGRRIDGYGSGSFTIDWSAASTLPEHDDNVGQGTFTYSRLSPATGTQIDVAFHQVRDRGPGGGLIDANYHYLSKPGSDGNFSFATSRTNHLDPNGPPDRASINSRWKVTGAGRADVELTSSNQPATTVTLNECWDQNFASQYLHLSWTPNYDYGDESLDCAFIGAEYASP